MVSVFLENRFDSHLSLGEAADNAAGAVALLARSGEILRFLGRANVFYRMRLGRQLMKIQECHLWDRIARPTGDEQNPAGGPYRSWDDFMVHGFPQITGGLSARAGYAALELAKSPSLLKLSEPELKKFENLGNAFELVRLERKGVAISEELMAAAQRLPVEEFRQMIGVGKKATVAVCVDSRDAARELQAINNRLKMADPDALQELRVVVDEAMFQAGGNPTDGVDNIIAACREQWRQEGILENLEPSTQASNHR